MRNLVIGLALFTGVTNCHADDSGIAALVGLLNEIDDTGFQLDLLKGIQDGLRGQRHVDMPANWAEVYQSKLSGSDNDEVRRRALALALTFGDTAALAALRQTLADTSQPIDRRREALTSLAGVRPANFADDLLPLVTDSTVNDLALASLAEQTDDRVPAAILKHYPNFDQRRRQIALDTLTARVAYANAMLMALNAGTVPRSDVTSEIIRKLDLLGDSGIQRQIAESWGKMQRTPEEKLLRIAELKTKLMSATSRDPDLSRGRAIFAKTCQQCHQLYGEGGNVGPEITGSHRANLDYLLLNVVDPNAVIGKDYQPWSVETVDGRVIVGIMINETARTLTVRTPTGDLSLDKTEIEQRDQLATSMMPEGLFDQFTGDELQDLVAYLGTTEQVPLAAD